MNDVGDADNEEASGPQSERPSRRECKRLRRRSQSLRRQLPPHLTSSNVRMSTQRTYAEGETSTIAASVTREGLGPRATSHRYSREPGHCLGRVRGVPSGDRTGPAYILREAARLIPDTFGLVRRLAADRTLPRSTTSRYGCSSRTWHHRLTSFPISCPSSGSRTMRYSRRSCSDTFCAALEQRSSMSIGMAVLTGLPFCDARFGCLRHLEARTYTLRQLGAPRCRVGQVSNRTTRATTRASRHRPRRA